MDWESLAIPEGASVEEPPEGPIPAHLQTLMGFLVSLQSLYRTHPELDVAKAAFSVSSKVTL